jgi:hypothetical protein
VSAGPPRNVGPVHDVPFEELARLAEDPDNELAILVRHRKGSNEVEPVYVAPTAVSTARLQDMLSFIRESISRFHPYP